MGFKRHAKALVVTSMLALAALAATAGLLYPSPRLVTVCGLAALPAVALLWYGLAALTLRRPIPSVELPIGAPQSHDTLMATILALETRLEHAPIALFQIDQAAADASVTPLNGNARRLIAPGRASDPAALFRTLEAQPVGQRSMIGFDTEQGSERALAASSSLTVRGEQRRLVAVMPVESELEAEALHAWRQLVHVLTHEIMNSLTPVASLSRTAHELLDELRPSLPDDVGADLRTALDAISRRADSLANFVDSYRTLSNVPPPRADRVRLEHLFGRVAALVAPAWRARGGKVNFAVEPGSLELLIDAGQLEQALINLLKNAAEATATLTAPEAGVSARLSRGGRLRIEVSDNGSGVPDALIPHIFTPFFSTKEKGGGIGLAMVRQLVHGNGGTVRYGKSMSGGARFIVTF